MAGVTYIMAIVFLVCSLIEFHVYDNTVESLLFMISGQVFYVMGRLV